MHTTIVHLGVTFSVSTLANECMICAVHGDHVSDEIVMVRGQDAGEKALVKLRAMSRGDILEALKRGWQNYGFGPLMAELKAEILRERLLAGEIVEVAVGDGGPRDIICETAYGVTNRLSTAVRVF